ncbi:hypothetical protein [Massilia rubra]|uniref:Uncharacterized protein n=1 Tax=Massilia rubra TaxID=2607910 RepID=A0ABX0LVE4_9BURK|nr:hypothetical protein [Massilia rubra]NHZ36738.1 hypothetical protein [Massilia rubra]
MRFRDDERAGALTNGERIGQCHGDAAKRRLTMPFVKATVLGADRFDKANNEIGRDAKAITVKIWQSLQGDPSLPEGITTRQ